MNACGSVVTAAADEGCGGQSQPLPRRWPMPQNPHPRRIVGGQDRRSAGWRARFRAVRKSRVGQRRPSPLNSLSPKTVRRVSRLTAWRARLQDWRKRILATCVIGVVAACPLIWSIDWFPPPHPVQETLTPDDQRLVNVTDVATDMDPILVPTSRPADSQRVRHVQLPSDDETRREPPTVDPPTPAIPREEDAFPSWPTHVKVGF